MLLASCAAAALTGAILAYALSRRQTARSLAQQNDEWQDRIDEEIRGKNRLQAEIQTFKTSLESERRLAEKLKKAALAQRTELQSLREKESRQSQDAFALNAERDELARKIGNIQRSLLTANSRVRELETEFGKSRDFYKGQLMSAFEQRKSLERRIDDAKNEQDSLASLLASARSEHASISNLLASAQAKLSGLDGLENQIIQLEADNAQLRHDVLQAGRRADSAHLDVAELANIKAENQELASCLETMEESRRQYEDDARRYRQQYDESESESETLRVKLGDIQQRLAEMEQEHAHARQAVATSSASNTAYDADSPVGDVDDLTQIVGIGKVLEAMLHRLGIYYFRQIAAFGPAELARVNAELKEFKGRIEHDDWIGQARELHFRKYGAPDVRNGATSTGG